MGFEPTMQNGRSMVKNCILGSAMYSQAKVSAAHANPASIPFYLDAWDWPFSIYSMLCLSIAQTSGISPLLRSICMLNLLSAVRLSYTLPLTFAHDGTCAYAYAYGDIEVVADWN